MAAPTFSQRRATVAKYKLLSFQLLPVSIRSSVAQLPTSSALLNLLLEARSSAASLTSIAAMFPFHIVLFALLGFLPVACFASGSASSNRINPSDGHLVPRDAAIALQISGIHPTYHAFINRTELEWVTQCLAQWCDDDGFIKGASSGKLRCYTDSNRPQGGVVAWICNEQLPARCSRAQLQDALIQLVRKSKFPTGWVWYKEGSAYTRFSTLFGFDWFCDGGGACGEPVDPIVASCEMDNKGLQASTFQWERIINDDSFHKNEDINYQGTVWKELPTKAPPTFGMAYPTLAPS